MVMVILRIYLFFLNEEFYEDIGECLNLRFLFQLFMIDKIYFEVEVIYLYCEYINVIEYQWSFQSD